MRIILALETSGGHGSVAVWDSTAAAVLAGVRLGEPRSYGGMLVPKIEEVLSAANLTPQDVDAVAVSAGPGSFTGLRIGLSAAKGFAWTIRKPLVPVPTLLALATDAAEMYPDARLLVPVMDAHSKGLVHTAVFDRKEESELLRIMPDSAVLPEELIRGGTLAQALFFGDAADRLPVELRCMPEPTCPRAATIARLSVSLPAADPLHAAAPIYLQPSAAEVQWEQRNG